MTHYNPNNCDLPYHACDLPPIFGVNGLGFSVSLTNRFSAFFSLIFLEYFPLEPAGIQDFPASDSICKYQNRQTNVEIL